MSGRAFLTAAFLALAAGPAAAGPASDDLCRAAGRSSGCIDTSFPRDSYRPPRDRDDGGSSVPSGCPECRAETIRQLGHFTVLRPPAWTEADQRRAVLRSIWNDEFGLGLALGPMLAAKPPAKAPAPPPSPLDPLREKIAAVAVTYRGKEDWAFAARRGNFARGKNKCNQFVAEILREAGAHVPNIRGKLNQSPPLAKDWADQTVEIKGWSKPFSKGWKPGDVVAIPHDYGPGGPTGHVGIVVKDPVEGDMSMSATATEVEKTKFGFRDDEKEARRFRRYVGTGE